MAGCWTITQIASPAAIFMAASERSAYVNGVYQWPTEARGNVTRVAPSLLRVEPSTAGPYKLGADAPIGAIAAVQGGVAFVQRADPVKGNYPDGADGAGFPVELYDHGDKARHYLELELLGPLAPLSEGKSATYTVRWSLHALTSEKLESPEVLKEIASFLAPK